MKRAIALMLSLLLLCSAALADQDILTDSDDQLFDNVKVLHRCCYAVGSGKDQEVHVYYELQNVGANPLEVDPHETAITFVDAAGQPVYRATDFILVCPDRMVLPGRRFFLAGTLLPEYNPDAFPAVPQAAEYSLYLAFVQKYDYSSFRLAATPLPCTFTFEKKQSTLFDKMFGSKGDHTYEFVVDVTNDTGKDIYDPNGYDIQFLMVLRDEAGDPVFVEEQDSAFASETVREIAAGETRRFTLRPTSRQIFDYFKEYDFTAADAEVFVTWKDL